jgi:hypothetical protein
MFCSNSEIEFTGTRLKVYEDSLWISIGSILGSHKKKILTMTRVKIWDLDWVLTASMTARAISVISISNGLYLIIRFFIF